MRRLPVCKVAITVLASVLLACDSATAPTVGRPSFMTEEGCRKTPGCWPGDDEPGDPYIDYPGVTVTPHSLAPSCLATSVAGLNSYGAGINDIDRDGMDDECEEELAETFMPYFVPSPYDCNLGGSPHWAAKYFPLKAGVVPQATVRVIYMPAYFEDCGVPNLGSTIGCNTGPAVDGCSGHYGDSEFVIVDLRYRGAHKHWYVSRVFMSAHYRAVGGETSREAFTCFYDACAPYMLRLALPNAQAYLVASESRSLRWAGHAGVNVSLFTANGKHGSYPDIASCNGGGAYGYDSCEGSPATSRGAPLFFSRGRNVGSWQQQRIDCLQLPGDPFHTGLECFWKQDSQYTRFYGWMGQPDAKGADPYRVFLTRRFECFALPEQREPTEISYCERGMVR